MLSSKNENTNMNINAHLWKASINILFIADYSIDALGALIITNYNQFLNLGTVIIDMSIISSVSSALIT